MNRHTKHYQDIRDGFVLREKDIVEEETIDEEDEEDEEDNFLGMSSK